MKKIWKRNENGSTLVELMTAFLILLLVAEAKDVLEYGGKFYVVGSGRQALQKNKTQTEDYYLLTLAAIAKELSFRHAEPAAEIHLAVDGEEFLESGYFAEETSDTGTVQVSGFWVSMTSEEETGERKD